MTIRGSLAAVVFASPWTLGLLVLMFLPWVIAWQMRPRPRHVPFAAMSLVKAAATGHRIWSSARAWLPPLLRSMLVTAVVLAAAEPRVRPPRSPLIDPVKRMAVVFDDSPGTEASRSIIAAVEALGERSSQAWHVERITADEPRPERLPAETALVIVADGFVPSASLGRWIGGRVAAGAGLLVLIGPRAMPPDRQKRLSSWLDRLGGIRLAGVKEGSWGIAMRPADERMPWETVPGPIVRTHAALDLMPERPAGIVGPPTGPTIVMHRTLGTRAPLLIRRQLGRGWAWIAATPWSLPVTRGDRTWSDLPAWPVFLRSVGEVTSQIDRTPPAWESPPGERGWLERLLPRDGAGVSHLAGASLLLALLVACLDPLLSRIQAAGKAVT